MTEFGLATVFGSVCFCTTFVPAFAYLVNFGVKQARPELTAEEKEQNKSLLLAFTREMVFIIAGLCLFYYFLSAESLSLGQCLILLLLFAFYVAVVCVQQWKANQHQKQEEAQGQDQMGTKDSDRDDEELIVSGQIRKSSSNSKEISTAELENEELTGVRHRRQHGKYLSRRRSHY